MLEFPAVSEKEVQIQVEEGSYFDGVVVAVDVTALVVSLVVALDKIVSYSRN